MKMKRFLSLFLTLILAVFLAGCGEEEKKQSTASGTAATIETDAEEVSEEASEEVSADGNRYAGKTPEEILSKLTLEQKAAQMVQPAIYILDDPEDQMSKHDYGSILSKFDSLTAPSWMDLIDSLQKAALSSESGVPFVYGQDDVHGVNYCSGSVIFPHNIGMGATGDEDLMHEVGLATADEAKLCHMLWNFAPCVAQSVDPRWGRTYESYGSDLESIKKLSVAYTKGLIEGGIIACPKHFFGDGNVQYGTGEKSDTARLIDRGDAELNDDEINDLLSVYQAQIDAGAQTIMISHSSVNGVKMHENAQYIQKLKNEMGFKGFIVSDWDSIQNLKLNSYEDQVVTAINSGIDMLMEVERFEEARTIIVAAVSDGRITEDRVDDAVLRILRVKKEAGIIDDPLGEKMQTKQIETGSEEYREIARRAVEESLVLLKNENNVLPLKKDTKVYILGPAADSARAQCGGWTIDWNQSPSEIIDGVTTIRAAFDQAAGEFGVTVTDDPDDADVVILAVGERSYAEWNGDTQDMDLCGDMALDGNKKAIKEAKRLRESGKKVVACLIAGRQILIDKYINDWDGAVMCYLPGSEGTGIVNVLCGKSDFTGKLPSPWYKNLEQLGTDECEWKVGYGLTYKG